MSNRLILNHLLLFFLVLSLAACSQNLPILKEEEGPTIDTNASTEPAQKIPPSSATAPTQPDELPFESAAEFVRPTYDFSVQLDMTTHQLSVEQTIGYTNNTDTKLYEIPLVIPPAIYPNVFHLDTLTLTPKSIKTALKDQGKDIFLQLNPALQSGQSVVLQILFQLQLPYQEGAFGFTSRQFCLADWYPFIPPFLPERGWLINAPGAVGEYLAYPLSDINLNLHLLPSATTYVVAASAPILEHEGNQFQYSARNVRNFYLAISPEYQMAAVQNDQVTVIAYTFPEHQHLAQRAAEIAQSAWMTFTEIYGPNERSFVSIVETDIMDGLEGDGLFYLSSWYFKTADNTPMNYYELLMVHEVSHQWIYGLIANDQANEPWLDEALATYSEHLYYEIHHPDLIPWWWDFRVYEYDPEGMINASIYEFDSYRPYVNTIYLQGVRFLESLRAVIGDADFQTFMYEYVQLENGDFRSASQFFEVLEGITEKDLSLVKAQFFH